jgi:uncharacterized membrane protein YgcG
MMNVMKTVGFQVKRLLKASSFTVAVVLFPLVGLAVEVKDVPNPRQINGTWVTDMAEMLDEPTKAQLNAAISQLERKNGTEIALVTVPETAPAASPKEFTTKLFNYWGIGKKGKDNGVLLLISKSDRRVEIETGYGMEAILPDAKVGNIINTEITPRFKQGDFKGGTLAGTKALVVAIENPQAAISTSQTFLPTQSSTFSQEVAQDDDFPWVPLVGGGVLLGGGLMLALAATHNAKRRQHQRAAKPSEYTSSVSSSHRYSQRHQPVHNGGRHVDVDVDVDVDMDIDSCDADNSDRAETSNYDSNSSWSSNSSDSSWSSNSSDSSWSSNSSDSSWSSDSSSSCSSYDSSSSSSDYGGGSSGGGGADGSW